MDYRILQDYADAIRRESLSLLAQERVEKSLDYERYADVIDCAVTHHRQNTIPNVADAKGYASDMRRLFSPYLIDRMMPEHRRQGTYKAASALASAMERAAKGRSPRRFFGLLD